MMPRSSHSFRTLRTRVATTSSFSCRAMFRLTRAHDPSRVTLVTDGQNSMAVAMVTSIVKAFFSQKKAQAFAEKFFRPQPDGKDAAVVQNERPSGGPHSASGMPKTQDGSFFDAVSSPADVFGESKTSPLMTSDQYGVIRAGETAAVVPSRWALPPDLNVDQSVNVRRRESACWRLVRN